jgi:alpha-L-rhamnosidase
MKSLLLWVGMWLAVPAFAQPTWQAHWVSSPDITGQEAAHVLFRRSIELLAKPTRFVVHISADNHYVFYVNGQQVCFGPQLSDIRHWRYETVDLAPYLERGKNTLAVEVYNYGFQRFFGMQSVHTALLVNGDTEAESAVHTSGWHSDGWRCFRDRSWQPKEVKWRVAQPDIIGGFYAAQPTDSLDMAQYPHGWQQRDFDDISWEKVKFVESATAYGGGFAWLLEPRNVPLQSQRIERIARIARQENIEARSDFLQGKQSLTIPPHSQVKLLLDHTVLTMGKPTLVFSGGEKAQIRLTYAENLFGEDRSKGNRNDFQNKKILGITDVVLPDGGAQRMFRPSWLRSFRFVQLSVQTQDQPLVLHDFYQWLTTTSIAPKAYFTANDSLYARVFDICQRTVHLCTQDYFLSDAYYETMQYLGDTKIHAAVWQALSGSDIHTRNALAQFDHSRLPDGNLTSCYPLKATFVHPNYSLMWVDMLYDYLQYSGDRAFIQTFVPNIRHTLDGFDRLIQPNGLVGETSWEYFVDWYVDSKGGLPPEANKGIHSSVVTLQYVYALQNAARLLGILEYHNDAARYQKRANWIKKRVFEQCFDEKKGALAFNPDKRYFDQHANILGILTETIPPSQARTLLEKITADEVTFSPASYYFRYYLFEALQKTQSADLFDRVQKPWVELVRQGLSTTVERLESRLSHHPTRSEAHPWSTAPAYFYFRLLAGIVPQSMGFDQVRIAPQLGSLTRIEGLYPTPKGDILFVFEKKINQQLAATLTMPEGIKGYIEWQGKRVVLKAGRQEIVL